MKYKVYIFGAGYEYTKFTSVLSYYSDKWDILGVVTSQKLKSEYIDGFPCITLDDMQISCDWVILAVNKWNEVYENLIKKGIDKKKIILSRVFYTPCFNFEDYIRLKESNVTIFSNFCLGGLIYHELGLEFLSPTINMYCLGDDYLEFLNNYEYYLSMPMVEYKDEKYRKGSLGVENFTPKGIIDNKIKWYFNHTSYYKKDIDDWNSRRKRVTDNIAVLMTIYTDEDAYIFDSLNFKKKVGFYFNDLNLKSVLFLQEWERDDARFKSNFFWSSYVNDFLIDSRNQKPSPINWIKFLNGEPDYLRFDL